MPAQNPWRDRWVTREYFRNVPCITCDDVELMLALGQLKPIEAAVIIRNLAQSKHVGFRMVEPLEKERVTWDAGFDDSVLASRLKAEFVVWPDETTSNREGSIDPSV